jgi:sterol desaturase/sphingolipid hydroxylase (fatty acid hydroxylase superfamily)
MFAVNGCWKRNSFSTSLLVVAVVVLVGVVVAAVVTVVAAVDIYDWLYVCIGDGDGYARWFCGYG